MALTDKLKAIANAIREKTGKTDPLTLDQMPDEISGIVSGDGEDLDTELDEQESLIEQLQAILAGKAAGGGGGGGEPMEMVATFADGTTKTYIIYGEAVE